MSNKKKQIILNEIIQLEAKYARLGSQINKLEREYAEYSEKKKGDRIILEDKQTGKTVKGIVSLVKFNSSDFFIYYVTICKNDWTKALKRNGVKVVTSGINKFKILA